MADVTKEVFPNGLTVVTEAMPSVRSVSVGIWIRSGSRHESTEDNGITHFLEHMVFKGTKTRSAEQIARAADSIGGHLDAYTTKEYTAFSIKVLDENLDRAFDVLTDLVKNPLFRPDDVVKEQKVIQEEIKMVEDTPDDLVHEIFTQAFWEDHPLGRPILGTPETVESLKRDLLCGYFEQAYAANNMIIAAAGNVQHERVRDLVQKAFANVRRSGRVVADTPPTVVPKVTIRNKELEQSHICLGTSSFPQNHGDRYTSYVMNTVIGGSMSSRLFQNVREKRGLAYSVFSGLSAYRDAGTFTVYAGCANDAVGEVIDLVVEELRTMKQVPAAERELRRAKDHLKGSLMLSLENTASRMSHLARQEIYFDRYFSLDETLEGVERVTAADLQRVAADLFTDGSLGVTVLGPKNGYELSRERLNLDRART